MANLGGKTTSGQSAWDKYIQSNKNWRNLVLTIESNTPLFEKKGSKLTSSINLSVGEEIVLKSNLAPTINSKKFAHVLTRNRKSGYVPITTIRKPTNFKPTGYETEVVNMINKHIAQNGNIPIDIKIRGINRIYKGISGAIQVDTQIKRAGGATSDPKADIILYQNKNNLLAPTNIFISHKKEGGPEAFQQYGGLSRAAGEQIYNSRETQKFLSEVTKHIKDDKLANPLFMKVKSAELQNMSIFGPDYNRSFGLQHVQLIGQGLPKLVPIKQENTYELDFTSHSSVSGDLSHFKNGYLPVFGATYREGRGFEYKGNKWSGARVGIYPFKLIGTRKGVIEIK